MTELELVQPSAPSRVAETVALAAESWEVCERISRTPFVPRALRGQPEAVLACTLYGAELGLGLMQSLKSIDVIEGRPGISAELTRALILRAGHELWVEESTSARVTMGGRRRETPDGPASYVTWTIEDAKRAGLERKDNWRKYPRAMLIARATGELARTLFPDVTLGLHLSEEVADGFDFEEQETPPPSEDLALGSRPDGVAPPRKAKATRSAKASSKADAKAETRTAKAPTPPPPEATPAGPPPLPGEDGYDDLGAAPAPTTTTEAPKAATAPQEAPDDDIVDAEVVEDDDDTFDPPDEATYTPAQAVAIRARKAGLDDERRHGLIIALTAGRTSTGKDLTADEVRLLLGNEDTPGLLERLEAGDLALTSPAPGEWSVSTSGDPDDELHYGADPTAVEEDPLPLDDPPAVHVPADADEWRAALRAAGVKVAQVLRHVATLDDDPPASVADLADRPDLGAKVAAWLAEEAAR